MKKARNGDFPVHEGTCIAILKESRLCIRTLLCICVSVYVHTDAASTEDRLRLLYLLELELQEVRRCPEWVLGP